MKIAITGGNGRVGQAVTKFALNSGHHVVSIDRTQPASANQQPGLTHIQADVTDYETFAHALVDCQALIHLAAIPSPGHHPDDVVHNNNVVSSYNALRAAAQCGIWRVCQASSVNAIGLAYSRRSHYDYFPLDEQHSTYNEDPYSLSKWICEQQADSFARRYEQMQIASLRLHWVAPEHMLTIKKLEETSPNMTKNLWGYVSQRATARAFLLGVTADFTGHEVFFIVAPETRMAMPSLTLKEQYYPDVPLRGSLNGHQGFFNCAKAERILGWKHDEV